MPSGPEFVAGFAAGSVALLFVALLAGAWRWAKREPVPLAGIAATAATLTSLRVTGRLPLELVVGILIVLAGAGLARALGSSSIISWFLLVPGAAVIAYQGLSGPLWIRHLAVPSVVVGCSLASRYARHHGEVGPGPLVVLISAGGIYGTVPDTEQGLALLGATAPLSLTGWPLRWARLGELGAVAWVAVAVWTVATGGVGRGTAIVGGLGSLGLLVLDPLTRSLHQNGHRLGLASSPEVASGRIEGPGPVEHLALHLFLALIASRVAGLRRSMLAAIVIVAAANLLVGWLLFTRLRGAAGHQSSDFETIGRDPPEPP